MAWTAFRAKDADTVVRAVQKHFLDHDDRLQTLAPDPWKASWEDDVLAYDRPPWVIFKWLGWRARSG